MRFGFTPEQEEFRATLRRWLAERSPPAEVRRLMASETGWERAGWRRLNAEQGLAGLAIPEAQGGAGFGCIELAIALEEAGRALLCAPLLATAIAARSLLETAIAAEQAELLPAIASGETVATLALAEESGSWDPNDVALRAETAGPTHRLHGRKRYVLDGAAADLVLVAARLPQGVSLFAVEGGAAGLARRTLKTMDETRKLADLDFDGTPARLLGTAGRAADPLARTMDHAAILLANEAAGCAERLREDSLAYAKMRMQFGRPIASFQSLKHKAADMLADVELAKSAAYAAASAWDDGDPGLPALASLAKAAAGEAALQTAIHAIQIHGGIGFTWDNDTHLWFKRAKSAEILFGDAHLHRERMMAHWESFEPAAAEGRAA